jgi:hypothetical protein
LLTNIFGLLLQRGFFRKCFGKFNKFFPSKPFYCHLYHGGEIRRIFAYWAIVFYG